MRGSTYWPKVAHHVIERAGERRELVVCMNQDFDIKVARLDRTRATQQTLDRIDQRTRDQRGENKPEHRGDRSNDPVEHGGPRFLGLGLLRRVLGQFVEDIDGLADLDIDGVLFTQQGVAHDFF